MVPTSDLSIVPHSSSVNSLFPSVPSGSSYPCKKGVIRSPGYRVKIGTCGCGSVWCPKCWPRRGLKKALERLSTFSPEYTRQVMLSVNHDNFADGKEAFEYVTSNKLLPALVRNLRRSGGVGVIDFVWFLEWHRGGWPHWHLFIEVEERGAGGMIGGAILRKYWTVGDWVTEGYIKSSQHWKNLLGYFSQHGYFASDKAHQTVLPDWALESTRKIRRWGSMECQRIDIEKKERRDVIPSNRMPRVYRVILESCGKTSYVEIECDNYGFGSRVAIESRILRPFLKNGSFIEGVGYCAIMDFRTTVSFLRCHSSLKNVLEQMQDFESESVNGCWQIEI